MEWRDSTTAIYWECGGSRNHQPRLCLHERDSLSACEPIYDLLLHVKILLYN